MSGRQAIIDWPDAVGDLGVICFLVAYWLLQRGRIAPNSIAYLGLNLGGSLLVLFSLCFHWNLPAFLLEAAWALISMAGILSLYCHPRESGKDR